MAEIEKHPAHQKPMKLKSLVLTWVFKITKVWLLVWGNGYESVWN